MAKPKKTSSKAKPSVKIPDLKPAHNPRGGKVTLTDFTITKPYEKASAVIFIAEPAPVKK